MSEKIMIGVSGRKRSGKDTFANALPDDFINIKFAGPIKAMMLGLLVYQGVDNIEAIKLIEGDAKEEPSEYFGGVSPRKFIQLLGTEFGRNMINEDIWVDCAMKAAEKYNKVVFSDVRFPNEAAAINKQKGVLVRVSRPDNNQEINHSSEAMIDSLEVDIEIENDGTVEQLRKFAREFI